MRGLKSYEMVYVGLTTPVAPFMGAWIEIRCGCSRENKKQVAPFMGAWIEINKTDDYLTSNFSRTLYGCVD